MNWDRISEQWKQFSGKIRESWGLLTERDIEKIAGSRDQLIALIRERYGISRDEAERQVDEWLRETDSPHTRRAAG
jgi:uncharacterized protein YjbJ (UPF0337 family)